MAYYYQISFTSYKYKFDQLWDEEKDLFEYLMSHKIVTNEQIFSDLEINFNEKVVHPQFSFNENDNLKPPLKLEDGFFVNESIKDLVKSPLADKIKLDDIQPIIPNNYKINVDGTDIVVKPSEIRNNSEKLLMYGSFLQSAYDALDAIEKVSKNLPVADESKAVAFFSEYNSIQELNNQRIDIWQAFVNEKVAKIEDEEQKKKLLAINDKMQQLKNSEADIIETYNKAQQEFSENLSKDLWDKLLAVLEPIGNEIEKGIQNVGKEAEIFGQNLGKNLEKGIQDIGKQLERDVQNGGMAIEVTVNFIGDQVEAYSKILSNAEKRLREGKIVDAVWHFYTDQIKSMDENLVKAVQKSSLLNSIASSVCTIYGGPGGAAAYAAWYTYKLTNDLSLALKTGLITGLTSYYTKDINGTDGFAVPKDEVLKKALATSAIGAVAIAASGGDEKAIMEGFLKGVALSVASNKYKEFTATEIEGRAPTQDPVLKLKLDYTKDKYLILRNPEGRNLFKTIFHEESGEYLIIPNDGAEILTLKELGKSVSIVAIASESDNGLQLFTETAIPMKLVAKVPYMNDMAYFHDIWCDEVGKLGTFATAVTIIPATVFTLAGTPTPLLTQIQKQAVANKEKIDNP